MKSPQNRTLCGGLINKKGDFMEKTIYGGKPKNPVAYCALHNGSLTVKEMKKKGCLGKQCHHLQKNEQHEYWNQRQIMKARKEN